MTLFELQTAQGKTVIATEFGANGVNDDSSDDQSGDA